MRITCCFTMTTGQRSESVKSLKTVGAGGAAPCTAGRRALENQVNIYAYRYSMLHTRTRARGPTYTHSIFDTPTHTSSNIHLNQDLRCVFSSETMNTKDCLHTRIH